MQDTISPLISWPVALILGVVIIPVLGLFKPIFSARLGKLTVPAAWLVALSMIVAAVKVGESKPSIATILVLLSPVVALIPTLVYRDQRRESLNLPPVQTHFPERLGVLARIGLSFLTVFIGLVAVMSFSLRSVSGLFAGLGLVLLVCWLSYAVMTGRIPGSMRRHFGSR